VRIVSVNTGSECVSWCLLRSSALPQYDKILKLTSGAKLESGDVKATTAVLGFILSRATKHSIGSESLSSELQQLGLPKGGGNPQGGTVSQTWWDVAGSSQPCLLHTRMEGKAACCAVLHHLPSVPSVPGGSSGALVRFGSCRSGVSRRVLVLSPLMSRACQPFVLFYM
uniref:Uncharacterized protein n=1 Tax=Serinus canaria TaxID=9135 RepID=A0A8C9NTB2_SERCA